MGCWRDHLILENSLQLPIYVKTEWKRLNPTLNIPCWRLGMKTVRIFSDRIRSRIRLEGLRSVCIRVWISNIWYRIRIRILKSHIYDVDIQSYPIRHSWHYPYSNPNPDRNMKTNVISVISVRIRSVFIPRWYAWGEKSWGRIPSDALVQNELKIEPIIAGQSYRPSTMLKNR